MHRFFSEAFPPPKESQKSFDRHKPSRFTEYDDSDLSEISTENSSKNVVSVPARAVPNHLLLVSLLEHLCSIYEADPKKSRELFKVLCQHLANMKVMSPLSYVDELGSLRSQYRASFSKLIQAAQIIIHRRGVNLALTGPENVDQPLNAFLQSDVHSPSFPSNVHLHTSRYNEEFEELEKIGKGGFGCVYKVRNRLDSCEYAIKKILLRHNKPEVWVKILREVRVLASLQHSNIVGYNAAWLEQEPPHTIKYKDERPKLKRLAALPGPEERDSQVEAGDSSSIIFQDTSVFKSTSLATNYPSAFTVVKQSNIVQKTSYTVLNALSTSSVSSVKHDMSSIKHEMSSISQDVSSAIHDMSSIKHETSSIKHDMSSVRHDTSPVRHDLSSISHDVSSVRHDMSSIKHDMTKLDIRSQVAKFFEGNANGDPSFSSLNNNCDKGNSCDNNNQKTESSGSDGNHKDVDRESLFEQSRNEARKKRGKQRKFKRSISHDPTMDMHRDTLVGSDTLEYTDKSSVPNPDVVLFIQMQLCSNTLCEWMHARNKVDFQGQDIFSVVKEDINMKILHQILKGLDYIHAQGLIHRDIKPKNIFLLGENLHVKIGDFGLTRDDAEKSPVPMTPNFDIFDQTPGESTSYTSGIGTSIYAAPEQLSGNLYDYTSDIYSVGMVMFELFHPFSTVHERVICLNTLRHTGEIPAIIHERWCLQAKAISHMVSWKPADRPSTKTLLHSELFLSKDQIIEKLRDIVKDKAKEIDRLRKLVRERDSEIDRMRMGSSV